MEEQPLGVDEIGSNEREREGAALRGRNNLNCVLKGCPHLLYLYVEGEGGQLGEGGSPRAAP